MNLFKSIRLKRLLNTLNSTTTHKQQVKAIKALGESGSPLAFDPLVKKLKGGYPEAAEALGYLGDRRATPILINYLCHENGNLRYKCTIALNNLGESIWQTMITGDDNDFYQMATSNKVEVIKLLIDSTWNNHSKNSPAKIALSNSKNPIVAKTVREQLNKPHCGNSITLMEILGDLKDWQATPRLIEFLKNKDKNNRKAAVRALGKIGNPNAIDPLLDIASDKDVQDLVIWALMKIGGRHTFESLINKLVDVHGDTRILAAGILNKLKEPFWESIIKGDYGDFKRLGETGDQSFYIPLFKLLEFDSCRNKPELKCAVIEGLAALQDIDCIELLKGTLLDRSKPVRKAAAEALLNLGEPFWAELIKGNDQDYIRLGESNHPMTVELLIRYLNRFKHDRQNDEYLLAERALEKVHASDALEIFLEALESGNTDFVRIQAVKSLGKIGDPVAVEPLIKILEKDKNEHIRICAARALGEIGGRASFAPLETILIAPSGSLRKSSSLALSKLGDPFWKELIQGDDKDFSRLGASGNPRAIELLIAMIRDYSQRRHVLSNILKLAKKALEEVNNPDALDTLIKAISDKKVQTSAIFALGEIGDPRASGDLLRLWNKLSGRGNSLLIKALVKIGDRQAIEGLIERIEDENSKNSIEIIEAIGEIDIKLVAKLLLTMLKPQTLQGILIAPSGTLRQVLAKALAKSGDPFWKELILGDNKDFSRLGASGNPRAIELLILMIRKYSQRKHILHNELELAKEGLEKTNSPDALNTLISVIDDEIVQTSAIAALGEIGNHQAIGPLLQLWDNLSETKDLLEPNRLQSIIVKALMKIGDKTAIDGLISRFLNNIDDSQLVNALVKIKDKNALVGLLIHVRNRDWMGACDVIAVLGKEDNKMVMEPLFSLLTHQYLTVRADAAKSLIRIAQHDFQSIGKAWLEISKLIEEPHTDFTMGQSCVGDKHHHDSTKHNDFGIGLEIPPELKI